MNANFYLNGLTIETERLILRPWKQTDFISSPFNEKSKISIFSLILSSWIDFGITITPFWIWNLNNIWAGVFPYFFDKSIIIGSLNISFALPWPKGA